MAKNIKRIILVAFVLAFGASAFLLYNSQNPSAVKAKRYARRLVENMRIDGLSDDAEGFGEIKDTLVFENGELIQGAFDKRADVKKIYSGEDKKRLVNYTDGYYIDLPKGSEFDFSLSPYYIKVKTEDYELTLSREYSPYNDTEEYISHYFNRFISSGEYRQKNGIELTGEKGNDLSVKVTGFPEDRDGYTYMYIQTGTRFFYRLMFKYDADRTEAREGLRLAAESLKYFRPAGKAFCSAEFVPQLPEGWSDETRELYEGLVSSSEIKWGIFTKDIYGEGIEKTVPELEKRLEYSFPIVLAYRQFGADFPLEFMNEAYDLGKTVELTYQVSWDNNTNLYGYIPWIEIYKGLHDDTIREFARGAKEFGKPFLFRINNEPNSDWTSYSGVVCLSDPEIYAENWRRIYRIFEEEGVDNAIWIFNPNDKDYPPAGWNSFAAYYPGNGYVQMLGVTGYNTGTYYKASRGEKWREFTEIYDPIEEACLPLFGSFPWIITEFASSSAGGDKAEWIEDMFENIGRYENIKAAVWFSYADYDQSLGREGVVSRPYWLDETEETLKAFKNGILRIK